MAKNSMVEKTDMIPGHTKLTGMCGEQRVIK